MSRSAEKIFRLAPVLGLGRLRLLHSRTGGSRFNVKSIPGRGKGRLPGSQETLWATFVGRTAFNAGAGTPSLTCSGRSCDVPGNGKELLKNALQCELNQLILGAEIVDLRR